MALQHISSATTLARPTRHHNNFLVVYSHHSPINFRTNNTKNPYPLPLFQLHATPGNNKQTSYYNYNYNVRTSSRATSDDDDDDDNEEEVDEYDIAQVMETMRMGSLADEDSSMILSLSEKPDRNTALLDDYELEGLDLPIDPNHRSGMSLTCSIFSFSQLNYYYYYYYYICNLFFDW